MKLDKFLPLLKCPYCCNLNLLSERDFLSCPECKTNFPIIEGVPVLLKKDMLNQQENKQKVWFEDHYSSFSKKEYRLENWRLSMVDRIFSAVNKEEVKAYLDIGCGATGYTAIEGAKRNNWVSFGVDISLEAMLRAKALAKKEGVEEKTAFIVCSAEHLPFKENTFNYVSTISVLEHIKNDEDVILGVGKIMKEHGFFYVCVPNTYRRMWPFLWPIYKYLDYKIGHKRHYSIEGLTNKMPHYLKLKKVYYNAHLIKLLQLILGKFHLIDDKQWWIMERKDVNSDFMGIQLNSIYQKI